MKIVDPGHWYELNHLDGTGIGTLTFVKRVGDNYPGNAGPPYEGTTIQEVLRALIDRCEYVDKQKPCEETMLATESLKYALWILEMRVRRERGQPTSDIMAIGIESEPTCPECGHVRCLNHAQAIREKRLKE